MQISLRMRDNGDKGFGYERLLDVDLNKEHNILELRQLGIYQNRQYELVFTDDDQSIGIAAIEEEVQILR